MSRQQRPYRQGSIFTTTMKMTTTEPNQQQGTKPMATFNSETDIVGSKLKADNKYGQNGYSGTSKEIPGQPKTRVKGFGKPVVASAGDWQTRDVSSKQLP